MSSPPVVELLDVSVSYRNPSGTVMALDKACMAVHQANAVSVIGRSGSGKSSLVSVLGLMRRPSAGQVLVDGTALLPNPRAMRTARAHVVGMVFQSFHLESHLSCAENCMLSWYATNKPIGNRAAKTRARELLDLVGLGPLANRRVATLSGGERQRVAIARALFTEPRLVIADEPTGNLDEDTAEKISTLLWSLPQATGAAVVVVTHDKNVAAGADRIISLVKGVATPVENQL